MFFPNHHITSVVTEIVGDELNKNDATDVQSENQLVRPRRLVVPTFIQGCYRRFVAGNKPPLGFRQFDTNILYICQQVPGDPMNFFYSTMFDINYGIPVYSAYVVSKEQASQFGTVELTGAWRQEKGKLSVSSF